MQVTARVDYALRALLVLAHSSPTLMTRDELAHAQDIPPRYLEDVLAALKKSGLVVSHRGNTGGYQLSRKPADIAVAEVARAVDGPLALVQGLRPENLSYVAPSEHLGDLWIGLRAAIRSVMEKVTLDDLLQGDLPPSVRSFLADPESWRAH